MKVAVAAPGRFHSLDLGDQLHAHGELDQVFVLEWGLDTSLPSPCVEAVQYPDLLRKLQQRAPVLGEYLPLMRWRNELFERHVAFRLDPSLLDLFVGFSGVSLRGIRRMNGEGETTVLERCSSHVETQIEIVGQEHRDHGSGQYSVPQRTIEKNLTEYQEADYIMTPSEFVRQSFLDRDVPAEKVWMVPYATDHTKYRPRDETDSEDDDEFEVLYAGGLDLRKGVHYLLDAWSELDLPDAKLVLAGGISGYGEELAEEYSDDPTIEFAGWVTDMPARYRSASAFVFPTLEEGSAYVTYEAMASGLPVVTTSHSGWVGTDGEHGIEIPVRDTDALADAIRRLYDDADERRRLGGNARDLITTSYTWDDYGKRVRRAYSAMLDERPATEVSIPTP